MARVSSRRKEPEGKMVKGEMWAEPGNKDYLVDQLLETLLSVSPLILIFTMALDPANK